MCQMARSNSARPIFSHQLPELLNNLTKHMHKIDIKVVAESSCYWVHWYGNPSSPSNVRLAPDAAPETSFVSSVQMHSRMFHTMPSTVRITSLIVLIWAYRQTFADLTPVGSLMNFFDITCLALEVNVHYGKERGTIATCRNARFNVTSVGIRCPRR